MTSSGSSKVIDLKPLDHNDRFNDYENAGDVARALMALDAGRMGSWSHNVDKDEVWGDRLVASLLGLEFDAQPWSVEDFFSIVHPDDVERAGNAVQAAYSGIVPYYDVEIRRKPSADQSHPEPVFWIGARGQVTDRDEDGNPLRVIGVNWDATVSKQYEEKLALLASEMDHRVKNAFAVIRALINIGEDTAQDTTSFADTLRNQVEAMATAHALSARMARMHKDAHAVVTLSEVINTALSPWIEIAGDSLTLVNVQCNETLTLPPAKVAAFAMMLYELSTNATKYGPLGELGGSLDVIVVRGDDGSLTMDWIEKITSKIDTTPTETGFGEILLHHCANNLGAKFKRDLTPSGMQMHLHIPPNVL